MTKSVFRQLFDRESCTFTYLVGDAATGQAALIDGTLEHLDRDVQLATELGLRLEWALDTHVHADHVSSAGALRERHGVKTAIAAAAGVDCVDRKLVHGDEISFGSIVIRALSTPGHTNGCMTFLWDGRAFTGDALLIRGCGRVDFQQGSAAHLWSSVRDRLFQLPGETFVYPGHDYNGRLVSTIGEEKRFNPRLGGAQTEAGFQALMAGLKLDDPKKMAEAVPANLACGRLVAGA